MGNGPSLNKMDLELFHGEHIWGLNRCYLLFDRISWRPGFYTAVDTRVVPDIADEIMALAGQLDATRFFIPITFRTRRILQSRANVFWFREAELDPSNIPFGSFSKDASIAVSTVRTVSITAIQLAAYLGFNPIFLIGCDTSYTLPSSVEYNERDDHCLTSTMDDDPNHFDPSYFGKGRRWHHPHPELMIEHYEMVAIAAREMGLQIYNATVGGDLEVFPRVDYRQVLERREVILR